MEDILQEDSNSASEHEITETLSSELCISESEARNKCLTPPGINSQIENDEDGYVCKERPLSEDISDNNFINTEFIHNITRKNKSKELGEETIKLQVYKRKCGFTTTRPLTWASIIEKYIEKTPEVNCRWRYGTHNDLFSLCQLNFFFESTKSVIISIHLRTGVIMVSGNNYHDWATKVFPLLKQEIHASETLQNSQSKSTIFTEKNRPEEDIIELSDDTQKNNADKILSEETISRKDFEMLWDENSTLKNALLCLESKSIKMEREISMFNETSRKQKAFYEEKIKDIEVRYDNKLSVFLSAISIDCSDAIDSKTKEIKKNILKLTKDLSKMESRHQKHLNDTNKKVASEIHEKENYSKLHLSPSVTGNNEISSICSSSPANDVHHVQSNSSAISLPSPPPVKKPFPPQNLTQNWPTANISTHKKHGASACLSPPPSENSWPAPPSFSPPSQINKQPQPDSIAVSKMPRLLVLMDSNRKFIEPRKLWTTRGTILKFCPRLKYLREQITKIVSEFDTILISCGVNDLEYMDGKELHSEFMSLINFIHLRYPSVKIVISHVTPRKDELNTEVIVCNNKLDASVQSLTDVFLVDHTDLQENRLTLLYDSKHIKRVCIRYFASNIKKALRLSYKMKPASSYFNGNHNPATKENLKLRLSRIAGYKPDSSQPKEETIRPLLHDENYLIQRVTDLLKDFLK